MKPIKYTDSVKKNTVILPETIEDKLNEAKKDYEEGRIHTEEETWGMFSKKYGFEYEITDAELNLYNCKKDSLEEKLKTCFERVV